MSTVTQSGELPIVARVTAHGEKPAVSDPRGEWRYSDLDERSRALACELLDDRSDLAEARVGILCTPGHDFVVAMLACWRAGGLAVPMNPSHPDAELEYVCDDAGVGTVVVSSEHQALAQRVSGGRADVHAVSAVVEPVAGRVLPHVDETRRSMMLYTSGTTGRPKGVVHTHESVRAQIEGLVDAWAWVPEDRILLVLPLHHVHGIVNVVLCALWAGAVCEAPGGFDPVYVWNRFSSGALTVFMAVPTIYTRLISAWEAASEEMRRTWSAGAAELRLMVSGSAALPVSVLDRWQEITGHVLLERYGMTEIGMGLSNTLEHRVRGHVGTPLPGVEVRIVDDDGVEVPDGDAGELLVRGRQLFREYWGRDEETRAAFVDGWFRTGDVSAYGPAGYRILGRSSVDIIKTGGEKVSALEIEEVLRTHDDIADCAVVGIADEEWGERVCAALVPEADRPIDFDAVRAWGKQQLASYKVPSRYVVLDELPRNAMGKVTKPAVADLFCAGGDGGRG
jgi:malonyl-CoA/methylmalonyl-CoA synthetase